MGTTTLGNRAVIGRFFQRLEAVVAASWFPSIAQKFESDQAREEYPFLGAAPGFREWVGGRHAKVFSENRITIENKHFEATLEVQANDLKRDKSGQIMVRVDELAERAATHPQRLITNLIEGGHAALCYDGQFFFDTDHVERDNQTAQSNDISIDLTTLAVPLTEIGTPTAPTGRALVRAGIRAMTQLLAVRDDQNVPMNEYALKFLIMVPTSYFPALRRVDQAVYSDLEPNPLYGLKHELTWVMNPRLTWTDKFAIFRTDGHVKPFIHQVETEIELKAKAEGSEFEFENAAHQYGVDQWHNVGYGYWQHACRATLT